MTLLPQHQGLIDASGISTEVARVRGYRSAETKAELSRLGFTSPQQNVPALLIPLHDVTGERAGYLLRPDEPRQIEGRICKYEMPKGASMVVDVPPAAREGLADPAVPLYIMCHRSLRGRSRPKTGSGSPAIRDYPTPAPKRTCRVGVRPPRPLMLADKIRIEREGPNELGVSATPVRLPKRTVWRLPPRRRP